jgi:hypothetical protein
MSLLISIQKALVTIDKEEEAGKMGHPLKKSGHECLLIEYPGVIKKRVNVAL